MIEFIYKEFTVRLLNESNYDSSSSENIFNYDYVFKDEEVCLYQSTNHGIKVYKSNEIYKSAIVRAVGGATGIHKTSAVIIGENILICCANKIFSLTLPELELNWMSEVDDATCFQIFNTANGIFIHGELQASRIDEQGNIIWSKGFADILVTLEYEDDNFIIHKDFIEIVDWNYTKYKLNFEGEFLK